MPRNIHLAVAIIFNSKKEILFVRKDSTKHYMLAGGKIEPGESNIIALARELYEELSISIPAFLPHFVGEFSAPAVNEIGYTVQAQLFSLYWPYPIKVGAEITQAHWFKKSQLEGIHLAPLANRIVQSKVIHALNAT